MEPTKPEQTAVNGTGTPAGSDTPLTREVRQTFHRELLVKRNKVGAETPLGYHLSNLDQQLRNWERETNPAVKAQLSQFIARSVEEIDRLSR